MAKNQDSETPPIAQYTLLSSCVVRGLVRLVGARIVGNTTLISLLSLNVARLEERYDPEGAHEILQSLENVRFHEFQSFVEVTTSSLLVYAAATLDSFLTDTARFLYLRHLDKLGEGRSLTLGKLLAAPSRASILNQLVKKKVRDIAFWPFLRRVEYLSNTFGLAISLDESVRRNLEKYSGVRNAVVHDQGLCEVFLDDAETLTVKERDLPEHFQLSAKEFTEAARCFFQVASAMYRVVGTDELQAGETQEFTRFTEFLDHAVSAFTPSAKEAGGVPGEGI